MGTVVGISEWPTGGGKDANLSYFFVEFFVVFFCVKRYIQALTHVAYDLTKSQKHHSPTDSLTWIQEMLAHLKIDLQPDSVWHLGDYHTVLTLLSTELCNCTY